MTASLPPPSPSVSPSMPPAERASGAPGPLVEPSGVGRLLALVRRSQALQTLLAAIVAWLASLAPFAYVKAAPAATSVLGTLAVLAGLAGPLLVEKRPKLARHLGVSLYLALSVGCWLTAGPLVHPSRLDPLLGFLGAASWGIFALAWSDRWTIPSPKEPPKSSTALPARTTLPRSAIPIATFGVTAGLALLSLAWGVRDPSRALVAQPAALASAVAVVTAASILATGKPKGRAPSAGFSSPAVRALLALAIAVVGGAVALVMF